MSLVMNHNLAASRTATLLNASYTRLSASTQRLSSGLRINSAADDAAGLAIRELMRCDVATLHQGIRNAMDGISVIQTADGALQVIDEKLVRMKELAEQAATGTYTSTQRLILDSEFQAMASEIDRIASATDFNGIKLLDGSLSGLHDGSTPTPTGAMKIHFGTGNDSAEDYYYLEVGDAHFLSLLDPVEKKVTETISVEVEKLIDIQVAHESRVYPPQGKPFKVDTGVADTESQEAILLDNGNVMVLQVCTHGSPGPNRGWVVGVTVLDGDGHTVHGPREVAGANGIVNSMNPMTGAARPGGGAVILQHDWTLPQGSNTPDMVLTVLDEDLSAPLSPIQLNDPGDPNVASGKAGVGVIGNTALAAWGVVTGETYVRAVNTNTGGISPSFVLSNASNPTVTTVGNQFIVTWTNTTNDQMMAQVYDDTGNPRGAATLLGNIGSQASVSVLMPNRFAMTWSVHDGVTGKDMIQVQTFAVDATSGGITQGPPTTIAEVNSPSRLGSPDVTQLYEGGVPADKLIISWLQNEPGTTTAIYAQTVEASGTILVPDGTDSVLVEHGTGTGSPAYTPSIVGLPNGNFMVDWQNNDGVASENSEFAGDRNVARYFSARPSTQTTYTTEQVWGTVLEEQEFEKTELARREELTITTQDLAQEAIVILNQAVVRKDAIRAGLGALQNRLENTITNLSVQAENVQSAESRISDVDVATEMTLYTRNQILTQSAVAMLAQANSLPEMALKLLG